MADHCTTEHCHTHLPTQAQLRESGASTLANSVCSLGGLGVFSRRMGLPMNVRRPNGYWDDFANLAAELQPFLQQPPAGSGAKGGRGGKAGAEPPRPVFPKQQQLLAAGASCLVHAIKQHGG